MYYFPNPPWIWVSCSQCLSLSVPSLKITFDSWVPKFWPEHSPIGSFMSIVSVWTLLSIYECFDFGAWSHSKCPLMHFLLPMTFFSWLNFFLDFPFTETVSKMLSFLNEKINFFCHSKQLWVFSFRN